MLRGPLLCQLHAAVVVIRHQVKVNNCCLKCSSGVPLAATSFVFCFHAWPTALWPFFRVARILSGSSSRSGRFVFFLCSLGGRLVTALTAISVTGVSAGVLYFKASLWHPQKPKDPSPITHPGHNPIPSCSLAAGYISTRLSVFAVCAYVTWMFLRLGCLLA